MVVITKRTYAEKSYKLTKIIYKTITYHINNIHTFFLFQICLHLLIRGHGLLAPWI